jgi:hypothetical protein
VGVVVAAVGPLLVVIDDGVDRGEEPVWKEGAQGLDLSYQVRRLSSV